MGQQAGGEASASRRGTKVGAFLLPVLAPSDEPPYLDLSSHAGMSGGTVNLSPGRVNLPLSSNSATLLSCSHCGETFHRREHRDRHVLRHTGARPFVCQICHKSFSRNDTLVRHQNLHAGSNLDQGQNHHSGQPPRRRRVQACLSCARVKQRCEGGTPCARCIVKTLDCSYASSNPSARAMTSPASRPRAGGSEAPLDASLDASQSVLQSRPTDDLEQCVVFTPTSMSQGGDTAIATTSPTMGFPLQDIAHPLLAIDPGTAPDHSTTTLLSLSPSLGQWKGLAF